MIMTVEDGRTRIKACTSDTSFTSKPVEEYTHFKFSNLPEIVPFMIQREKNMVRPDRPQIIIERGKEKLRFACRLTKGRLHTHIRKV